MIIVNNSIPGIVREIVISEPKKEDEKKKAEKGELIKVSYNLPSKKKELTIKKEDREKFLRELSLSMSSIDKFKKKKKSADTVLRLFKKPSLYAKTSNRIFSDLSKKIIEKPYIEELNLNLRKANMPYLINTYVSMAFMSALIGFFAGILAFIVLIFFSENIKDILLSFLVIPGTPLVVLISFYFYPFLEKGSISKKINQELPFVAIHMSAIAGSGIEPSQIFKIIAMSDEYKYSRQEFKKVVNQVNVYGYDLVNALKNASRSTSSSRISELFNGLATTISSGGSLTEFLDKRADTLLFEYRLERERFTKTAETFMDIYISVVIAAPMIMMLMLVLISISGISIGIPIDMLGIVIILIVALINFMFLVVLHLKQPSY